jgi:predicted kinase
MRYMYIMQGVPGSSKSTVADAIAVGMIANGVQAIKIRSTDALFMVDGVYKFDQSKLGGNHMKNIWLVEEDCKAGAEVIIVDNTNIKQRDAAQYINLAKKYGYSVTVIRVDAGLAEAKKRNSGRSEDRKIPEHVIERMYGDMQKIRLDENDDKHNHGISG